MGTGAAREEKEQEFGLIWGQDTVLKYMAYAKWKESLCLARSSKFGLGMEALGLALYCELGVDYRQELAKTST